ncbi:lipoprotein [Escherichia coli KTE38]|nr:lipoprotein [Escherichia coli KTE37]EOV09554.1 lipoprotein [Escherichia coli KTE38]
MNRIYRVIWNCTLQVFQACSELTRRVGKTSTVNLRKSSGLTTKFSRLTLGVLLALSGSASGASLEVDNGQITNINTDVAYDAYLVGWYGTGVLNILAGGNASLTTITTSVIGGNEDSEGTVNVLGGTWRLYDSGNNARPLNVGQSGTGTLNIKQKGHVDGGYLRIGSSTGGVGTVNVEGEDSVLTTELFEIASTNSAGDYTLTNALKGDGLMRVQLSSSDKIFGFTHATGTEFAGVAQLKDSTFTLERDNTAALTHAMLQSDSENTTSVKVGEQSIGGLAMNGGTLIFDTDIPAATLAEGYISVDTLVVGAGDYTWKGRNYQVNGTGDVLIDVPKPWNDPMANNPLTTLNLLEHDDSHVGVQLVKAQTVIGSGGSLTLRDLQGDEVEADKTLHIAQNGTVVAEGDYGFRLTTAPGDGLYVNYGLKALNIHGGQKLTLAEHGGAYGATADMSAKIGGEGDLAINTVRQVSLSNGQNDYQGATYVQMGTLRTDADGALGNTRELNISNAAIVDLNGSAQTVETFTGLMGSTVLFKEGSLTVNKGGISQGELTGGGNLNVTGGTLAIEGLNARYNALTSISPNAEVSLDNTQGLGRGNIASDGLLTLKNVTGELNECWCA